MHTNPPGTIADVISSLRKTRPPSRSVQSLEPTGMLTQPVPTGPVQTSTLTEASYFPKIINLYLKQSNQDKIN